MLVVPDVRAGLRNGFERPDDGELLSSSLRFERPSAWSDRLRGGFRVRLADRTFIDASAGYPSFGQSGLDIRDAGLALSQLVWRGTGR